MKRLVLVVAVLVTIGVSAVTITGCTSAPRYYSDAPYIRYDQNTEYAISDESDGFTVLVYYSLYQYFGNENVVLETAKQNAMALAYEHADKNNNGELGKAGRFYNSTSGIEMWVDTEARVWWEENCR